MPAPDSCGRSVAVAVLGLIAILLTATTAARAQPWGAVAHPEAQAEFDRGVAASRAGRWQEAREAFQRAYELSDNATVLVNLAAAQVQTGRLVDAAKSYRRFLELADDASPHRADALRALTQVQGRIATVRIRVSGSAQGDEIRCDGAPLPIASHGGTVELDPGSHDLSVWRSGREAGRTHITLAEGQSTVATLVASSVPIAVLLDSPEDAIPTPEPEEPARRSIVRSPLFWVVAIALAAGAAIGIWLAVRE